MKARIFSASFWPLVSTPVETSTPQGLYLLYGLGHVVRGEAPGQEELVAFAGKLGRYVPIEALACAALQAFNQAVQG